MALQLQKDMTTGVSANYWSIVDLRLKNDKMVIKIELHLSKAIKTEGKSAIEVLNISVDCTKDEAMAGNIYEIAYNKIKASNIVEGIELNEFVEATNV